MKTKLYLLFFFVFPLFMSACRGDDPIPDPPVDGKRTVLVYMAADNSINPLASFTDGDLEELKAGMALRGEKRCVSKFGRSENI